MRVLFLSTTGDSLGLAQRVALEGHNVDFYTPRTSLRGAGAGLFAQVPEWRPALLRADFTVVDGSGWGAHEETLRATGRPFLGGGRVLELALGSQRERAGLLANCGINDAWTSSGSGPETFSGSVTVCSEGWFNGTDFARPFVHSLISQRLLNGDLGPQVQSQGAIVRRSDGDNLTAQTVERLTPFLRHIGHRGPVSVESAVVADAAYAVGVLAGFRFDAVEAMVEGLGVPLTSLLFDCAIGTCREFELAADAMMSVRLTIPPWPYAGAGAGAPGASTDGKCLVNGITDENIRHLFLCGMGRGEDGTFYTTEGGLVLKATAIGRTTPPREGRPADYTREARRRVYRALAAIECADKQYRTDVGVGANESILQLQQWGWL